MLCQSCQQRQATVHVTKVVNNTKTEFHLCQECASKSGDLHVLGGSQSVFSNLISGLLKNENVFSIPVGKSAASIIGKCKRCGCDYSTFMNTGFLGCSDCYTYFSNRLQPLITQLQGNAKHVGKIPKRAGKDVRAKQELEMLKKELQQLVAAEEYEKAALTRDKIREIEKANEKVKEAEISNEKKDGGINDGV